MICMEVSGNGRGGHAGADVSSSAHLKERVGGHSSDS